MIVRLAFRNILRNKRRSILTLLSMSGGYFLLASMLSISEGSYNNMIDIFTQDHTGHVQIHKGNYLKRPSLYKTIDDPETILSSLQQNPNVISASPRLYGPSLAYGKNKTFPAQVVGIDPKLEANTTLLKHKVKQGKYLTYGANQDGYYPAMIGVTLAHNLGLGLGDELILISQGIDGSIANDIFIVDAIVGTSDSFERNNVYLSMEAMSQFLSTSNQVHEIAILLAHQKYARAFARDLQLPEQLTVSPWQEVEESFYKSMEADKQGNYASQAIIMLLVSIGVLNTVLMSTMERTREFGVLKSIGTRPMTLFRLILLESFLLALFSCLIGFIFSAGLIFYLQTYGITLPDPIDMGGVLFDSLLGEFSLFVIGVPTLVVLGSTCFVSLIPAIRAARTVPVEAMQAT
ncbi:ABC transporter permease [Thalassotalea agarivorans]|uniref:ABC-type transport system, involved in lipoprotein release, permease component n=1 Tax=Thalassotalea agarivorans TaxID=349064 RepID=A0A1H9Z8A9_THASX|nr:ABC transporter permease [Thalassotalea agarivorans]SES77735.1 ABC-type transport system, involved in lipoprotein release, permease component [Thalassotalea agarivorans]